MPTRHDRLRKLTILRVHLLPFRLGHITPGTLGMVNQQHVFHFRALLLIMLKLYGLIPDSTLRRMRFPRSTREAGTGEKGEKGKGKREMGKGEASRFSICHFSVLICQR
jgi:hypothetical protein